MKEEWKDIEGYENYQISNLGRVKSLERECKGKNGCTYVIKERILKLSKNEKGYLRVGLYKQKKLKMYKVHRLVAFAFLPNPQNLEQINHRDEDKTNNHVTNLEWCTAKHNINHGTRNQRIAEKLSKKVQCVETGKIYASTHQVERELGFRQSGIWQCCKGKLKTAYGFHWRYVS